MNLTTDRTNDVVIVRVSETRLMYPSLSDFSSAISTLLDNGTRKLVIDLAPVSYVDSATIGCLMDLHRQANEAGAVLKLSGVQKRVQTMLTLTGCHNFLEIHADEPTAVNSF
jgi:anti-anti-sigma factor